ncbi:hypothetical protein F2Q68_00033733 [Brassica cretica]|uniref:Uncharacterized protein n=1 Tax=Brassica cretica TaxID=69181 RepID=A0A8S9H8A9_BRACR|nr:hypothetical protein F2Q68_00033733 [Brassica cretica]
MLFHLFDSPSSLRQLPLARQTDRSSSSTFASSVCTGSSTIDASKTLSATPYGILFHHPPSQTPPPILLSVSLSSSAYIIRHRSDSTPSSTPTRYLL